MAAKPQSHGLSDDEIVNISSQIEHAVLGARHADKIDLLADDSRKGVTVMHASGYGLKKRGTITLDVRTWNAMLQSADFAVKTMYFVVDMTAGEASFIIDAVPRSSQAKVRVPLFVPTLFGEARAPAFPEGWGANVTANSTHLSLVSAVVCGLHKSLLGWMCVSPDGRRPKMRSDTVEVEIFPYPSATHAPNTVLLVAQLTLTKEDGDFVISSRTIEAIVRIGHPTTAVSVDKVYVSPVEDSPDTVCVAYHIVIGVVQPDENHWQTDRRVTGTKRARTAAPVPGTVRAVAVTQVHSRPATGYYSGSESTDDPHAGHPAKRSRRD